MAGEKRKLNLLAKRKSRRIGTKGNREELELQSWSDLPTELLELILCRLSLVDNICASVVCKRWNSAAVSVRVVNQSPWLMFFPKFGTLYEFYNPSQRKTYSLDLLELNGCRVCYSVDGWLLLFRSRTHRAFFFNPFTREVIRLPIYDLTCRIAAFSCAPTSAKCIVFTMHYIGPTVVGISTCHPGATEWLTLNFPNRLPFVSTASNKVVFCNGIFYCLSTITGCLGAFNPQERTWNVLPVPPTDCRWWKGKFMAKHKCDIFVIYTCSRKTPTIFKLDQLNMVWVEMKTLDGMNLFASSLSSYSGTDLPGLARNRVYFPKVRFYGRRCISYSLNDCRYYPRRQFYDWGKQDSENIWIEPPQNFSGFI